MRINRFDQSRDARISEWIEEIRASNNSEEALSALLYDCIFKHYAAEQKQPIYAGRTFIVSLAVLCHTIAGISGLT